MGPGCARGGKRIDDPFTISKTLLAGWLRLRPVLMRP